MSKGLHVMSTVNVKDGALLETWVDCGMDLGLALHKVRPEWVTQPEVPEPERHYDYLCPRWLYNVHEAWVARWRRDGVKASARGASWPKRPIFLQVLADNEQACRAAYDLGGPEAVIALVLEAIE